MKTLFNDHWEFAKVALGTGYEHVKMWQPVEIPHDWLIGQSHDLYETATGWYRKTFFVEKLQNHSLIFEGVYMDSTLYVNGQDAGTWKNGYTTFEHSITDYLVEGSNELLLRVDYQSPNSRWYSGAGIYRRVWHRQTGSARIVTDGVFATTTKLSDGRWELNIRVETEGIQEFVLRHELYHPDDTLLTSTTSNRFIVEAPKLWDIGQGNLYEVRTYLEDLAGNCLDQETVRVGFRTVEVGPDSGFALNGRRIKLNGACQHHDLGALGAAVNKEAIKRQFLKLREMGVNAIRTAHNPPATELMELADEMGFLIVSELYDMWKRPKTTYDFARFFEEWSTPDVNSWVRRDRNCPSLIMWGIGNEIYDTHAGPEGLETTKYLERLVQLSDPTRPVTVGSNYMPWENAQKVADHIKLAGYNYAEKYYEEHHEKHPDWIIYGSETASTVQSRGIYKFPLSQSMLSDDDLQCSSLGNSRTSWGAQSPEACVRNDREADFSLGQFIWTGFDYIGEPTPYHTKNSYLGQIDTAGFEKDSFYIYKAGWTEEPFIYLFPYWDFSEGQLIDVRAASNAPVVELFFNGSSLGKKTNDLISTWQLPYEPGTLTAIAYDEKDCQIAITSRSSFGDPVQIRVKENKNTLKANGEDLIFLEITTVDADKNPVENARNRIDVDVSGAGRLIGLDNGDSTDYESYKGTSKRLFSGKLLAMVAATDQVGEVIVKVSSPGLQGWSQTYVSEPSEVVAGSTNIYAQNSPTGENKEIPIRKIELHAPVTSLNETCPTVTVKAEIFPKNATYEDIQWRVTDASGIDSNLVEITSRGHEAVLTAKGDGAFYLRAMTHNGCSHTSLISQLDFTITGLGDAYLNPYEFVFGGVYTRSNIPLANGNERGVATDREKASHVIFEGLDFGDRGADTVTLPLFLLENSPLPIEIWEGAPGEKGSDKIADVIYTQPAQWNTYLEETFTLPRKLKGITTLSFVFPRKIHLKGFKFEKIEKAYECLLATDCDHLSGDSYTVAEKSIEKIGNNVTLTFEGMHFNEGASSIEICGKTPLEKNSIRIQIGDVSQLVEFAHSQDDSTQTFALTIPPAKESVNVSFIFLPGCQFDFKWFQFSK